MAMDKQTALQHISQVEHGNFLSLAAVLRALIEGDVDETVGDLTADSLAIGSTGTGFDTSGHLNMAATGQVKMSNAVVAAAGTTAADAAVLTAQLNFVTGADDAKGVALPAATDTQMVFVQNASATASLKVYPVNGGNDNINGLAEDAAFTLAPGRGAWFMADSATHWYTPDIGSGVVQRLIPVTGQGKVGATAGWVITAGDNIGHATLPASQTASTLVIPLSGLDVGDMITAWGVAGQVESAGNNVTLTADLRKLTNAAADNSDASVSTDNVGTLTADTILSAANLGATGLTEVVAVDESFYLLLTGTTAAATDIDVTHILLTIRKANA